MEREKEKVHLCRRCGRRLKTKESQERGMGTVCASKTDEKNTRKLF